MILAAGVGRRLGDSHAGPKVLLEFDGVSLLERHLSNLTACGVRRVAMTVGFEAETIQRAVAKLHPRIELSFLTNPRFRNGSLVSLQVQGELLRAGGDILLMDGDVLCDARMIARLGQGAAENTLLVDRHLEPGDEPVKLCFRKGADGRDRIVDFRKQPEHAHDWHGESVGFFRFSAQTAAELADRCDHYVDTGRLDVEYEEAIRDLMLAEPNRFGAVDVSDLPWTEIDFEEDVARARFEILPQLVS
ncbi:NTP transferase domain-containing protein [Caulobacter sp. S45]|uniref:phosphocholine cytidylyltransferase family protein n=1 Tax=Caulobacter sp. S45 TaxID=1641861 RepID=UPI001C20954D|nr:phosphocholine cytidylyltransferase family protein [Caulobacter sp. S45]